MQALLSERAGRPKTLGIGADSGRKSPAGGRCHGRCSLVGLNYKDALAITGKGKIIRNFPMIPGSILPELYAPAKMRFSPVRRCYSLAGALVKTTGVGWRSRRE